MSYPRQLAGLGWAQGDGPAEFAADPTVYSIVSNGGSPQQGQALKALIKDGNVGPQYASLVMHWDGSIGPASDAVIPPGDSSNYWPKIFAANRYLVLLNPQNIPITTIGAITPAAAQAIMDTYAPVAGDTSGRAQSTAATAPAEQAAAKEAIASKSTTPVDTTTQNPAPAPAGAPVHTVTQTFLPYGTPVTLSNGQQGYADGQGGIIAGAPPSATPASTGPLAPTPSASQPLPVYSDPGFFSPPAVQLGPTGSPVDTGAPAAASFTLSPTVLLAGAGLAALLLFGRRKAS